MKKTKKMIRGALFVMLFVSVLNLVSQVLKDGNNVQKYKGFYEEAEDFDVLFFGSSRMLDAVYPTRIWSEHGITSYNMAQHAESLPVTYWQIKNALRYNKPQLIVVDVSVYWGGKIQETDVDQLNYLHKSLDHISISPFKIEAVNAILSQEVSRKEYYVPFLMYHTRWNELTNADFEKEITYKQGAEYRLGNYYQETPMWTSDECNASFDVITTKLKGITSLCEEEGIPLLFTCLPASLTVSNPVVCEDVNQIKKWAKEQGVDFLNLGKIEELVNYQTDFLDLNHLNPFGAKKVTSYLGDYIDLNYDIDKEKNLETIKKWNEKVDLFYQMKCEILKAQETLECLLTLVNDSDFSYVITFNKGNQLLQGDVIVALIKEIGGPDLLIAEGSALTIISDHETGDVYTFVDEDIVNQETSLGTVEIIYEEDQIHKNSKVYGVESRSLIEDSQAEIYIFDAKTGMEIESKYF